MTGREIPHSKRLTRSRNNQKSRRSLRPKRMRRTKRTRRTKRMRRTKRNRNTKRRTTKRKIQRGGDKNKHQCSHEGCSNYYLDGFSKWESASNKGWWKASLSMMSRDTKMDPSSLQLSDCLIELSEIFRQPPRLYGYPGPPSGYSKTLPWDTPRHARNQDWIPTEMRKLVSGQNKLKYIRQFCPEHVDEAAPWRSQDWENKVPFPNNLNRITNPEPGSYEAIREIKLTNVECVKQAREELLTNRDSLGNPRHRLQGTMGCPEWKA